MLVIANYRRRIGRPSAFGAQVLGLALMPKNKPGEQRKKMKKSEKIGNFSRKLGQDQFFSKKEHLLKKKKYLGLRQGSNIRLSDCKTNALTTAPWRQRVFISDQTPKLKRQK
jgi:hypothetical protein